MSGSPSQYSRSEGLLSLHPISTFKVYGRLTREWPGYVLTCILVQVTEMDGPKSYVGGGPRGERRNRSGPAWTDSDSKVDSDGNLPG